MTEETRNQNNDVEGQSTESGLSGFEGISSDVIDALRTQEPELFGKPEPVPDKAIAAGKPAEGLPEGSEDKENAAATGADGGSGRPEQAGTEKTAPLAALHEERARRKELQDRLERLERQNQELAQMQLEQARSLQQRSGPAQPPEPVDPLTQLVDQKLSERLRPFQEREQQTAALRETEMRVARCEAEAKTKYADYDEVVAPVMQFLTTQAAKAQQGDRRAAEGLDFVLKQANPAEAAYTMGIRLRYEQEKLSQGQNAPGETTPAGITAGNNPPSPAEQEAAAAKAVAAANYPRGLELGSGGGGGERTLTPSELENMTSDDWAKLPAATRKKLLEGRL